VKKYQRIANLFQNLKQIDVCVLPNLQMAYGKGINSDMVWFDIFDESLKEGHGKSKYSFRVPKIHEREKKKEVNINEIFTQIQ